MSDTAASLNWIVTQHAAMCEQLHAWASINTGTVNLPGLATLRRSLMNALEPLGGDAQVIDVGSRLSVNANGSLDEIPVGSALRVIARPDASVRILLCIHYDTVYGVDSPFQRVSEIDHQTWRGPGVCDAKGGLVVMLKAIEAFERTRLAANIGWEIFINPDEEVGSPASAPLLIEAAKRNTLGLLFEPALPGGNLVSARKASSNLALVVRGRSAHVGRDAASGRNAIHALATFIQTAAAMNDPLRGLIVNVGKIEGGGPSNVVPDLAIGRLNLRCDDAQTQQQAELQLQQAADALSRDGVTATLHTTTRCPPKPLDSATEHLLELVARSGQTLGLNLGWCATGGVSDGNRLAAAGLPNVDTLGVRGGAMHSHDEFVHLDSLVERAALATLVLLEIAAHVDEFATFAHPALAGE